MANEIKVIASLQFAKSGASAGLSFTGTFSMTGTHFIHGSQTIGTTEEALELGDTSPSGARGFIILVNRDATNNVSVRADAGVADLIIMRPGEPCMFRPDALFPRLQAAVAPVRVEYLLLED